MINLRDNNDIEKLGNIYYELKERNIDFCDLRNKSGIDFLGLKLIIENNDISFNSAPELIANEISLMM